MFVLTAAMGALSSVGGTLAGIVGSVVGGGGIGVVGGGTAGLAGGFGVGGLGAAGISSGVTGAVAGSTAGLAGGLGVSASTLATLGSVAVSLGGMAQSGGLAEAQLNALAAQQAADASDLESERKRTKGSLLAREDVFLGGANYELLGQVEATNVENQQRLGAYYDARRADVNARKDAALMAGAGNILGTAARGFGNAELERTTKSKKKEKV